MSFKNIGTVLSNVQKGSVGLTDTLKGLGSLEEAANALKYVDQFTDKDKIGLLKGAFKGVDDDAASAALGITDLGNSMANTTKQSGGLGAALKGMFAANPISSWATVATLGFTAIFSAVRAYQQYFEELRRDAVEAANAWSDSQTDLDANIEKAKELREQLASGDLSQEETVSVKEQLLDIQSQIVDKYGEEAAGIDLVNGKLETTLALYDQMRQEDAQRNLATNDKQYSELEDFMTRERNDLIAEQSGVASGVMEDLSKIFSSFEDRGITTLFSENDSGWGTLNAWLDGITDIEEAEDVVQELYSELNDLAESYTDDENALAVIESIQSDLSAYLKSNQEEQEENLEGFKNMLAMQLAASGDDSILRDLETATNDLNEALSEGDTTAIEAARSALIDATAAKDEFLADSDNSKFRGIFSDVEDQINDAALKLYDFQDIFSGGELSKNNQFVDQADQIKTQLEALDDMDLTEKEIKVNLETAGFQEGDYAVEMLAKIAGFDLTTETGIETFIDWLVELGVVSEDSGVAIEEAASSFDTFSSSVQTAIENVTTLQEIMGESVSGGGISGESLAAFREMFGDDAEAALEKTANGYHLNEEALHSLQQKQNELVKSDYLGAMSEQYEDLRKVMTELAQAQVLGEDTSGYVAQIEEIQGNIQSLQDLQLEYEATTSAYQQWQNAMAGGSERDMYENIQGGYAQVTDLIERGWGGSEEVRTYVDLLSSADLSTANVEEVMAAYERLGQTIGNSGYSILDFFTVDEDGNSTTDGIYNFFDTVNSVLGDEFAKINENGEYEFDFLDGGDQKVAEALGMDVEAVQSILRAAIDAGFVVNLDQPIQSIEELKTSAEEAKTALSEMGDTSLSDINLDSTSYSEITDNISKVQDYIDEVNDSDLDIDVKEDKIEAANALLEYLVQQQSEINNTQISFEIDADELNTQIESAREALEAFRNEDGSFNIEAEGYDEAVSNLQNLLIMEQQINDTSVVPKIDVSQATSDADVVIQKLQEFQTALQELNSLQQIAGMGVDVDTSAAQEKVSNLAGELQGLSEQHPTIFADLGINDTSISGLAASIQAMTPEMMITAGVNADAVNAYLAEPKDDDAKVVYTVDDSAVTSFLAQNHDDTATLSYNVVVRGMDTIQRNITGTITYNATTSGTGSVNGTAHALGTVKSYRFHGLSGPAKLSGDWGIKKGGTSLVGELGPEILVRGSEFRTIGDAGAEFIQTRPGDVIFNHKQTRELLKNGYVTSRGRMIGANAYLEGSAYSSGSGPSRRPSRPSYGMDDSYASSAKDYSNPAPSASKAASNISDATEAADEFEETLDWIEIAIDRIERAIDKLSKTAGNTYELFTTRNNALSQQISKTTEEINLQQRAYDRYIQEANSVGLSEEWAVKVRNGLVDIEDITDENLKNLIDDYSKWYEKALDCADAIDDLKISVQELYEERFNNVVTEFDGMIGQLQDRSDLLDAYIDQTETKGYLLSSNYYSELMKVENQILSDLQSQRNAMNNALNEAVAAGQVKEYSESWYDMRSQIDEVTQAIVESETALIEYQNSIRQLQWDAFDLIQERVSDINDEAEFLMDLLDAHDMFDEHGKTTEFGAATFGLLGTRFNTYMQQADMYREEMAKLDAEIAKDPYNQTLLERRQELLELQRESISAAEDEKDAIKDLVEDGINAQLESLQDLIDKYTDMLDVQKDIYDYQQQMAEQQQELSNLEKQLAAYAGDNSEEGRLKRQELQNQLSEARQNLEETQYDQQISQVKALLDDMYTEYETILNMRLDDLDQLVSDVINNINLEASNIRDTIVSEADGVGYDLTNTMETIWSDSGSIGTILSNYSGNFTTTMTALQAAIDAIKNYVADMAGASDTEASGNIGNANSSTTPSQPSSSTSNTTTTPPQNTTNQSSSNSGNFFIPKRDTYPKGKLDINTSIVDKSLSTLNSLDCGNTLRTFSATT